MSSEVTAVVVLLYMVDADELHALRSRLDCCGVRAIPVLNEEELERGRALHQNVICFIEVRNGDSLGLSLLRLARKNGGVRSIVVLSSNREPELRREARDAGANDYLAMPVRNIDLEMRLARCHILLVSKEVLVDQKNVTEAREAKALAKVNTRVLRASANRDKPLQSQARSLIAAASARRGAYLDAVLRPPRISEREEIAEVDPLTGMLGPGPLQDHLDREFARSARYGHALALLVLELDQLGRYEKLHGKAACDGAVHVVADVLRGALRSPDIVARFDRKTFVVLATDTGEKQALQLGVRLRASLAQENGHAMLPGVTVSIGIAQRKRSSMNRSAALIEAAQRALAVAQKSGGDCCIIADSE